MNTPRAPAPMRRTPDRSVLCSALAVVLAVTLWLAPWEQTAAQTPIQPLIQAHPLNSAAALADVFTAMTWPEIKFVIERDASFRVAYDSAGPAQQAAMQANPAAVPWGRFIVGHAPAALPRLAQLMAEAMLPRVAAALARVPSWSLLDRVIAADARLDANVNQLSAIEKLTLRSLYDRFDWQRVLRSHGPSELKWLVALIHNASSLPARGALPATAPAPALALAGRVFRAFGESGVYLVDAQGFKRPIANADVFNACGLSWNDVIELPPAETARVAGGTPLTTAALCLAARPGIAK